MDSGQPRWAGKKDNQSFWTWILVLGNVLTWLIFSISAVFSTKDILASGEDGGPQSTPLLLTAYQMTICAVASYFLPSSRSGVRNKRDQFRVDTARVFLLAAVIFFNYAYVDLSNSFIQISRVAVFPLVSIFWHLLGTTKLGAMDAVKAVIMLFGLLVFYIVNPIFTPGVLFVLAAIILEAASVALSPKEDQGLCPSTLLFEAAPIGAALCWTMVITLESPSVLLGSLSEPSLLENGVVTLATHVAALYVHENAASLPMLFLGTVKDVLIVVLSCFFWQTRLEYLQLGGYCTALSGLYLFKNRKAVGVRNFFTYLSIVAILFSTSRLPQVPPRNSLAVSSAQSVVLFESSWFQLDSSPWHHSGAQSLSGFLQSRGIGNDQTLFITIASRKYIDSMINFKLGLDMWGLGDRFVVLCLDRECVQAAESHEIHAYTRYLMTAGEAGDDWHLPVARIKFAANIDLLDGGYDFVLLDGDVYLTGRRHPLSGMRPLVDPSWHLQFQADKEYAQWAKANIGWYWARPTPAVREYFVRSQRWWELNKHEWDQSIMNDVRNHMVYSKILEYPKTIILNPRDYKSTMLFDWPAIFMSESKIDAMNDEGVTVHYTMIYNDTKTLVAKQFGQWFDESYYTSPPWILQPLNIAGTKAEILDQIAFAVHLAKVTNRSFMWPNRVRLQCEWTTGYNYTPPILLADFQSVADAVPWVEGMYFRNRERFTDAEITWAYHSLDEVVDGSEESMHAFLSMCQSEISEVLVVDFQELETWKVVNLPYARDAIRSVGIVECRECAHMERFSAFNSPVC